MEPMRSMTDQRSQDITTSAVDSKINQVLDDTLRQFSNVRVKIEKAVVSQSSMIIPVDGGVKRKRASKTSDKEGVVERTANRGITVDWANLDSVVGRFDAPGCRVLLNLDLPQLEAMRRSEDANSLALIAFAVFADGASRID